MNHNTVGMAMCRITEDLLWKPRIGWALKHNPNASLTVRLGSGSKTCLTHARDVRRNADMTLTYGIKMIADKSDPESICKWLTAKEVHQRKYFQGEINLLNVLTHTMAHEFGHFVQVILGRRYDGSVHNPEFYTILDRIHQSGEADKLRDALHRHCLHRGIDLTKFAASTAALNELKGLRPDGQKHLNIRQLRRRQLVMFRDPAMKHVGLLRVVETKRTRVIVEQVAPPNGKWSTYPQSLVIAEEEF